MGEEGYGGGVATSVSSSSSGLHVVVRPPLAHGTRDGRISCRPSGMQDPIAFDWSVPAERPTMDETGSEAWDVVPGTYRVRATDARGISAEVRVDATPLLPRAVVVEEYRVTPASTERARDGSVEVVGSGVGDGWRFLWTCGSITDGPLLRDVPCGTYYALPLFPSSNESSSPSPPPVVVHNCAPGRVTVRGDW